MLSETASGSSDLMTLSYGKRRRAYDRVDLFNWHILERRAPKAVARKICVRMTRDYIVSRSFPEHMLRIGSCLLWKKCLISGVAQPWTVQYLSRVLPVLFEGCRDEFFQSDET